MSESCSWWEPRMYESRTTCVSHKLHMCTYALIWVSHVPYNSLVCMSHVTHMNGSCHTYECVMSHIWMRHVTRTNESCHCMSHVTHMNESCHTYEWVMSHIWMRHTYGCIMSHISMRHVSHMNQSLCDMTHYLWHNSCVPLANVAAVRGSKVYTVISVMSHDSFVPLSPEALLLFVVRKRT